MGFHGGALLVVSTLNGVGRSLRRPSCRPLVGSACFYAWWPLGLSVEVECAYVVGAWISKHNGDKSVRINFEAMVATINVWVGLGSGSLRFGVCEL